MWEIKTKKQGIIFAFSEMQEEFQDQKHTIYRLLDINVVQCSTFNVATANIKWKPVKSRTVEALQKT